MEQRIGRQIEKWKKLLLDFSKRNRLYNFRPTLRTTLEISLPEFGALYSRIVIKNETLQFAYPEVDDIEDDEDGIIFSESVTRKLTMQADIEVSKPESVFELQKSLSALKQRAKNSLDEQGIHVLYLMFGVLNWKQNQNSEEEISSPLLLVPVKLSCANLASPYKLELCDSEEVVLNPTLKHKLVSDRNIILPDFDSNKDDLAEYLEKIDEIVAGLGTVKRCVYMTLLSFLKMSMYEDISKNGSRLRSNPHIQALCGAITSRGGSDSWNFDQFDHDNDTRPHEVYQILDADSSQMDAILAAKRGTSFVLQGPPGTGKSQTIANIISETLAEGKKVLFVSEKRAALEVVYNRLHSAGLSDFCFTLHDHRANRRQILTQLERVMKKAEDRFPAQSIDALNVLQRKREKLNRYHNELHTPCSGYDKTFFEMIGELSKLSDVPDVIFDIPNVDQITKEYIDDRCDLLERFAAVVGKRSEDYEHNCWRYSTAEHFTQSLIHAIDAHLLPLIPKLRSLRETLVAFNNEHENNLPYTVDNLLQYEEILKIASENPGILFHWIKSSSIASLTGNSYKWESLINEVKEKRSNLASLYTDEFFNIAPSDYLTYLRDGVTYLKEILKIDNLNSFITSLSSLALEIKAIKEAMDSVYIEAESAAHALGLEKPKTRRALHRFVEVCELLKNLPAVPCCWFDSSTFAQVAHATPAYNIKHDRIKTLEKHISQNFDDGIYGIEHEELLRRFRTEYSSVFKFFKPAYYRDVKEIKAYYKNSAGLKKDQIHSVLNSLKERAALRSEIEKDFELLTQYYGAHYKGIDSDWSKIKIIVRNFGKVLENLPSVPARLKELLQEGSMPIPEVTRFLDTWQQVVPVKLYTRINEVFIEQIEQDREYSTYSDTFGQLVEFLVPFIDCYSSIATLRKLPGQYTQILQEVEALHRLFECELKLENNNAELTHDYGFYYHGLETDWCAVRSALQYSEGLRKLVRTYNLSSTFISHLCADASMPQRCCKLLEMVREDRLAIAEDLKWFAGMFPADMNKRFYQRDLQPLSDAAEVCQAKKHLLEEWIDFRTQRQRCVDAGLGDYVQHVENNKIPTKYIKEGYLKRFYVLWLDAIKPQFSSLDNFRGNLHETLIREFRELDTLQFKIAVKRIQKKLLEALPNFNVQYTRKDEIGILKRELEKKTRLKTLRRLFSEIPNLAMSLKPCFMMSPLSVSVFLESEAYNFDLVIFDEASQVHTEDSIGAIMRGKQVIIVGDDKQLPPTSFFRTTLSTEDYADEDTDEFDDGANFESILAEAKANGFREHSLRWHYRSRHEDLIAFSNMKLYEGKLITFPSTTVKAPDCGVEFVHVSDGCYERKKSKGTNPREAKRVAELVFAHFRKYGRARSLGVVAFSEAQQNAIEAAIIEYRRRDKSYELFFNEEVEEAFFVKNLENVQGDERDTIIFSVGYAKDETGNMSMNFGPLNRKGIGERRLNVAVTRAKHNVKLVASILPTDIDTDRTDSEGVRMLRSYMEFAQQGIDALKNEVSYNNKIVKIDSPFEQSVYDYLTTRGYQVQTQVGCSGYRIDMAVEHPHLQGKFAIGIECDGASYHSSRTARERDRLRQSVLEDMGWTIYRIWSTDWIKSPESQGAKLEDAILAAFEKNTIIPPIPSDDVVDTEKDDAQYIESLAPVLVLEPQIIETRPLKDGVKEPEVFSSSDFVEYKYAELEAHWNQTDVASAIFRIIETEQPIHIYELSKRLLPLFNRQKVSAVFREEIEKLVRILPNSNQIRREGDFLYLSNFDGVKVRVPGAGAVGRGIAYIHPKEIELAFISIVKTTCGLTKNDLFKITATQFGWQRMGDTIRETLVNVYEQSLCERKLVEVEGKVLIG